MCVNSILNIGHSLLVILFLYFIGLLLPSTRDRNDDLLLIFRHCEEVRRSAALSSEAYRRAICLNTDSRHCEERSNLPSYPIPVIARNEAICPNLRLPARPASQFVGRRASPFVPRDRNDGMPTSARHCERPQGSVAISCNPLCETEV